MTTRARTPDPYTPDVDPELAALWADLTEIAQERDQYARQAADLRTALSDAHAREGALNDVIARLRHALTAAGLDPDADLAPARRRVAAPA